MEDNTKFKTSIVGGFDKGDVVNYIKKLAAERNELRKAYEESEEKFKSLTDSLDKKGIENKEAAEKVYRLSIEVEKHKKRLESIQRENEESKQFKIDFIDNTLEKLSKVETTIAVVNENITIAFERAHTELMVACDTLAEIAPMLEKSFKQFDEIRANIDEQKQTLLEGDKKQKTHTDS